MSDAVACTAGVDIQANRIEIAIVLCEGDRAVSALPDRLSIDPRSPFYARDLLPRVGVFFKGVERTNVAEYSVSEGWVRLIPPTQRRTSRPGTVKLQGTVEPYWRA